MKKKIGNTIRQLRVGKGMKLKEFKSERMSTSQLSGIEKGENMPSTDKFINLLSKLNVKYDEFILLMDDEYLEAKVMTEKKFAELVKIQNIYGLKKLAKDASTYYNKYGDIYFKHVELMSRTHLKLIQSNNDYNSVRKHLQPINEYLSNTEAWNHYELLLICNCLFMFEIEKAIFFGEKALHSIEENYSFYRNEEIACTLLNNLAIYSLDYKQYYYLALKYSKTSEELTYTSHHATKALYAKIIRQLAYFKLENGKFDKHYLLSLIDTFTLLGWDEEYHRMQKFVSKHGVSLEE